MGVHGYFEEGYSGDHLLAAYFNHLYEMMDIHHDQVFKGFITQGAAMINAVDWLYTRLRVDGEQLDLAKSKFSGFTRKLEMRSGTSAGRYMGDRLWQATEADFLAFLPICNPLTLDANA